jgi:hypothetical protein
LFCEDIHERRKEKVSIANRVEQCQSRRVDRALGATSTICAFYVKVGGSTSEQNSPLDRSALEVRARNPPGSFERPDSEAPCNSLSRHDSD